MCLHHSTTSTLSDFLFSHRKGLFDQNKITLSRPYQPNPNTMDDLLDETLQFPITIAGYSPHVPVGDAHLKYWKFLCIRGKNFPSVSAALEEAEEGDIIFVRQGVYQDNFEITKPVHIIGLGGTIRG